MLYEIGYLMDGKIVRGGIKAPVSKVAEWIERSMAVSPEDVCFAVPASSDAITQEEFERENAEDDA